MWLFHLCVFLCLARYGFSQDVYLTCPEAWVQGTTTRLTCDVEISRWATPNPCATLSYTADFVFQPVGSSSGSSACTVLNVDTSCSGTANPQGCGCTKTSTYYNLFYDVVADKATHENGSWNCQPVCRTSAIPPTNPLNRQTSAGCTKTVFPQPCDNNPCKPGNCTVVNDARKCNCDGSYYTGPLCQDDPCKNWTDNNPDVQFKITRNLSGAPRVEPEFGYKITALFTVEKCSDVDTHTNCNQMPAGGLSGWGGTLGGIVVCCAAGAGIYYVVIMIKERNVKLNPKKKVQGNVLGIKTEIESGLRLLRWRQNLGMVFNKPEDTLEASVTLSNKDELILQGSEYVVKSIVNKHIPDSYKDTVVKPEGVIQFNPCTVSDVEYRIKLIQMDIQMILGDLNVESTPTAKHVTIKSTDDVYLFRGCDLLVKGIVRQYITHSYDDNGNPACGNGGNGGNGGKSAKEDKPAGKARGGGKVADNSTGANGDRASASNINISESETTTTM